MNQVFGGFELINRNSRQIQYIDRLRSANTFAAKLKPTFFCQLPFSCGFYPERIGKTDYRLFCPFCNFFAGFLHFPANLRFAQQRQRAMRYRMRADLPTCSGKFADVIWGKMAKSLPIQSTNSTMTPGLTILASSVASQLVRRTQPWLKVLPILDGSGVPWMQ